MSLVNNDVEYYVLYLSIFGRKDNAFFEKQGLFAIF